MASTATDCSPPTTNNLSPIDNSQNESSKETPRNKVLGVVVCGSPCIGPQPREGLLSPLLTAAAANAAATRTSSVNNRSLPLQNNVPASESEKLTTPNVYVLRETEQPRPKPSDIESTNCPSSVEPFRKAWWAGVRPTTCERTCRHRSKICDAIQLCNDCTGYYCKWLAELCGIPVLKASGRVDPLLFERDPLAKLYWERISKVACCPKVTAKCLMCIRRYQLFTHFLPGNLDFRALVHESVMKLHEEGFAVDMGLIRKVTRRHLECIAGSMELRLPVEYMSAFRAYDFVARRGPLVDVLTNGLSSALQGIPQSFSSPTDSTSSPARTSFSNSGQSFPVVISPCQTAARDPSDQSDTSRYIQLNGFGEPEKAIQDALSKDIQTLSTVDSLGESSFIKPEDDEAKSPRKTDATRKRRSRRQVKRPTFSGSEEAYYYGEDNDFLSMIDEGDKVEEQDSDVTEDNDRGRKKRRRGSSNKRKLNKDWSFSGLGFEHQLNTALNGTLDSLANQFSAELENSTDDASIGAETFQILCRSKGERGSRQASRDGMWVPNSALKGSWISRNGSPRSAKVIENEPLEDQSFDLSDGSPATLDRLASMFLQRLEHRTTQVSDSMHRQQLIEEERLGEAGVRGVFWDPSKEGWCALLPLIPSSKEIDSVAGVKRKILCFSATALKSFTTAKWSAVYERLRRHPCELEFINQDIRQELSNWVRENIESVSASAKSNKRSNSQSVQITSPTFEAYRDCSMDTNHDNFNNNDTKSESRLLNLLDSLAEQVAQLSPTENNCKEKPSHETMTNEGPATQGKVSSSVWGLLASLPRCFDDELQLGQAPNENESIEVKAE